MEHTIKAIQRIAFKRNTHTWEPSGWFDKWKIILDGVETTLKIYSTGRPFENLDGYNTYAISYELKDIRKHKDYQQIRHKTIAAILNRYTLQSRNLLGLDEIQND